MFFLEEHKVFSLEKHKVFSLEEHKVFSLVLLGGIKGVFLEGTQDVLLGEIKGFPSWLCTLLLYTEKRRKDQVLKIKRDEVTLRPSLSIHELMICCCILRRDGSPGTLPRPCPHVS